MSTTGFCWCVGPAFLDREREIPANPSCLKRPETPWAQFYLCVCLCVFVCVVCDGFVVVATWRFLILSPFSPVSPAIHVTDVRDRKAMVPRNGDLFDLPLPAARLRPPSHLRGCDIHLPEVLHLLIVIHVVAEAEIEARVLPAREDAAPATSAVSGRQRSHWRSSPPVRRTRAAGHEGARTGPRTFRCT